MKFAGFDDWVEIFRGGPQTDSAGRQHDGDGLIEAAVKTFDAAKHEPPVCVGHPATDAPAFGWVAGLKAEIRDGAKVLMAKFDKLIPEFVDAVKQGLYKKRSAAFYPDGSLRHVAFLGAAPPAVKALTDLKFEDREFSTFEFGKEEEHMDMKEVLELMKFWKTSVDAAQPAGVQAPATPAASGKTFTEADLLAERKKAAEEAASTERTKVEAEFAEKQLVAKREARKAEISAWVGAQADKGRIIPAWEKLGLVAFMCNLDGETEIVFSEAVKESALEWFKRFMGELPKTVEFEEVAGRGTEVSGSDTAGAKLVQFTEQIMEKKKTDFNSAFSEAQLLQPDLARQYAESLS